MPPHNQKEKLPQIQPAPSRTAQLKAAERTRQGQTRQGQSQRGQRTLSDALTARLSRSQEVYNAPAHSREVPTTTPDLDARLIPITQIRPNPGQPRRSFDDAALAELAASLQRDGQLQPIVVRPAAGGGSTFEIIMGERRWRAAQKAGLRELRAVVREADDDDTFRLALIENIQREDLNEIDRARALVALKATLKKSNSRVTWPDVGAAVGLTKTSVLRLVALLKLPPDIQGDIRARQLTEKHGRALLRLQDAPEAQTRLRQAVKEGLSGDAALERVAQVKAKTAPLTRTEEALAGAPLAAAPGGSHRRLASAPELEARLRNQVEELESSVGQIAAELQKTQPGARLKKSLQEQSQRLYQAGDLLLQLAAAGAKTGIKTVEKAGQK